MFICIEFMKNNDDGTDLIERQAALWMVAFWSMDRYIILWIVIPIYGPLFRSMDRQSNLWAVISVYGPSSRSMDRQSDLWTVIPISGPISQSMGRQSNLWAVISIYGHSLVRYYCFYYVSSIQTSNNWKYLSRIIEHYAYI